MPRQVPNADFFLKTVPLLDGGQDVGMVLSPQVGALSCGHRSMCGWRGMGSCRIQPGLLAMCCLN